MKILIYTLFVILFFLILISLSWRFFFREIFSTLSFMFRMADRTRQSFCKINTFYLNPEAEMKILDVGCGPGRLTIPIGTVES
jgi:hypothetical protein